MTERLLDLEEAREMVDEIILILNGSPINNLATYYNVVESVQELSEMLDNAHERLDGVRDSINQMDI